MTRTLTNLLSVYINKEIEVSLMFYRGEFGKDRYINKKMAIEFPIKQYKVTHQ